MPAKYTNLKIESGATFSTTISLKNADKTALNLTGYTGTCKMRRSYYSDSYVFSLTVSVGSPATDGSITISSTATNTATYKPGRYVYDVEMTSGATILRVLEGIIEVSPNATK
jgi:hypothetical protein